MKTVALYPLGRAGNQLFRAAFALALCEQNGYELRMAESPLEKIFTLGGLPIIRPTGSEDIVIDEYRQAQKDLIYSRADCRRWFDLRPEVKDLLSYIKPTMPHAHLRRGDYISAGYPVVSVASVESAMAQQGVYPPYVAVTDDAPGKDLAFAGELEWVPDFVRLMRAPVLFRANSSFSWWAATLGNGEVYSPLIAGFEGGREHDNIPFVAGNWPRLAGFEFTTDLFLRET